MADVRPVVVSGPSGAGKSTVVQMLIENHPANFGFSVSETTRQPREKEVNGRDYTFVTIEEFLADIEAGKFLEHATFAGNKYGTPRESVDRVINSGRVCILDVEANGVRSIYAADPPLNAHFVFIEPPSLEELESRLRARGTEAEEKIQARLHQADIDMKFAHGAEGQQIFDLYIVNDCLQTAYTKLVNYLHSDIENSQRLLSGK